ncbi:MAG TPA: hypothetical protein VF450_10585 [Noviherbaspirillum sp.]
MRNIFLIGMLSTLSLAGCNKVPEPKTSAAPGDSIQSSTSVALPKSQMPPSDATIPPHSASSGSSGNSGTPSQERPSTLSKQEEQSSMPESGQVNNHSVPGTTPGGKP